MLAGHFDFTFTNEDLLSPWQYVDADIYTWVTGVEIAWGPGPDSPWFRLGLQGFLSLGPGGLLYFLENYKCI